MGSWFKGVPTGVKDRNGIELKEGDSVRYQLAAGKFVEGSIKYDYGSFRFVPHDKKFSFYGWGQDFYYGEDPIISVLDLDRLEVVE